MRSAAGQNKIQGQQGNRKHKVSSRATENPRSAAAPQKYRVSSKAKENTRSAAGQQKIRGQQQGKRKSEVRSRPNEAECYRHLMP